jgi:hypothetical protein
VNDDLIPDKGDIGAGSGALSGGGVGGGSSSSGDPLLWTPELTADYVSNLRTRGYKNQQRLDAVVCLFYSQAVQGNGHGDTGEREEDDLIKRVC